MLVALNVVVYRRGGALRPGALRTLSWASGALVCGLAVQLAPDALGLQRWVLLAASALLIAPAWSAGMPVLFQAFGRR